MGQREPCLAQFAIESSVVLPKYQFLTSPYPPLCALTYSAYCMTPLVPSWLGNGTCVGIPLFIGGGVPGLPLTKPGLCITGSAGFEEVEEMKAAFIARKGMIAVVGLAMRAVSKACRVEVRVKGVPRSASAEACRVVANMVGV